MKQLGECRFFSYIAAAYFLFMCSWVLPINIITFYAILAPFSLISKNIQHFGKRLVARWGNAHFVTCARYFSAEATMYGARLEDYARKRCLGLINHLGLVDHFLVMTALHNLEQVPDRWLFIIYNVWLCTPMGLAWYLHGNFFVNVVKPDQREAFLKKMTKYMDRHYHEGEFEWVMLYPEGSRLFLIKDSNARFSAKNNLPELKNCAYPKLGAALAILKAIGPDSNDPKKSICQKGPPLEYVVDITLGYQKGVVPTMGQAMMGDWPLENSKKFAVHLEVLPITPEMTTEEGLKEFLFAQYSKKDKLLAEFYETGVFPGESRRAEIPSDFWLVFMQISWIAVYMLNHYVWIAPTSRFIFSGLSKLLKMF
ncbi:unnamed protein product [Caenorhabditis auriculariae]|uniref:Phospholipid/glycerol acyltransferase domain-containing protein n=1 Tax=Caenorhabditis auriculariae TaxID=2777116 RepID=A0A8S1HPA9_9PELO|nr:unnamed protein product [Caenorhabditis auriculariae]